MRRLSLVFVAPAGLLLAFCDGAAAQQLQRAERLLGGNESPPVVTDATGNFRARLFPERIEFRLRYRELEGDVTQAHLHVGNPGTNGGIVAFLCAVPDIDPTQRDCPASGLVEGEIVADDVLADGNGVLGDGDLEGLERLIRQGAVYANVHSELHTSGEVRGQLSPRRR
jgi:hypothetical protein